jgi:hypothetical protein
LNLIIQKELMQLVGKQQRADLAKDCPKFNVMAKIQWQRIACTLFILIVDDRNENTLWSQKIPRVKTNY